LDWFRLSNDSIRFSCLSRDPFGDEENLCFFREASGDGVDATRVALGFEFAILPMEARAATSKAEIADRDEVLELVST
jgi:hypothetical protein